MSTLSNKTAYKWTISSNLLEGINIFKQGATQKGHGQLCHPEETLARGLQEKGHPGPRTHGLGLTLMEAISLPHNPCRQVHMTAFLCWVLLIRNTDYNLASRGDLSVGRQPATWYFLIYFACDVVFTIFIFLYKKYMHKIKTLKNKRSYNWKAVVP